MDKKTYQRLFPELFLKTKNPRLITGALFSRFDLVTNSKFFELGQKGCEPLAPSSPPFFLRLRPFPRTFQRSGRMLSG